MKLSDDKVSHLTHVVLKGLLNKNTINLLVEEGQIRKEIKRVFTKELKIEEEIDLAVRKKLHSYSKKIPEGSPEWDVLYQKFFHEEMVKKGKG